jgi:hypothetical protein
MRIMKSRKMIRYVELVAVVIKATRSGEVLESVDIKKDVDKSHFFRSFRLLTIFDERGVFTDLVIYFGLTEKDYMERTNGNNYTYVA